MAGDRLADLDRLEARGRWLRRGALLLIVAAAVAAGLLLWQLWLGGGEDESREVETIAVSRATIRATVAASGTAEASDETELRFASVGRVEKILVTLGQEVKAGDPLAVLETDDLENRLATAETNLAVTGIRLRQLLKGADEADLAAAEQGVASAEAALSKAQRDLNELLEGASAADLAAAEQTVASAQASLSKAQRDLNDLLAGPSAAELAAAEQSVASAEASLESARAKLAQLEDSPSEAELAAAEAAVAAAEANVSTAENLIASAQASLVSAEAVLRAAIAAYCNAIPSDPLCSSFPVPVDQASIDRLLDDLSDPSTNPAHLSLISALVGANSAYISAENGVANAEESLEAAEAALASAQASLEALGDVPTSEEFEAAEGAVSAAEESLAAAEARLEELEEGPSAGDIQVAEDAVSAAEEGLAAAVARLQELQEGASAADIQAAEDAVASAEASLSAAVAKRDEVLGGADPDDVDLQRQQVRLAEIAVEEARKALDEATLKAPYDGTVAAINIGVGDLVSSQSPLAAITLLTPGALKVRLTVGETDLPSLRPGMVGAIIFDALQERPFPIVLTAIGLAPQVEQGIVIYVVEGALVGVGEEADDRPVPGMNGSAVLVTEERRDVLVVPNRAIRRRGEEIVVEVMVDGKSEIRAIETGLSDTDNTEVVSGLEEGDLVAVPSTAQAEREGEQEDLPEGIR